MSEPEVQVVYVVRLPLPVSGFVGLINGLQKDYVEPLFIRNCPEGYEVYKIVKDENKAKV